MKYIMLGIVAMMITTDTVNASNATQEANLSHAECGTLEEAIAKLTNKIQQRGDLPYISVARQIELLQAFTQFELGRFHLQRGGLNGYWTNYVVHHPEQGRLSGLNSENQPFTQLESYILDQAPFCLATQQRFEIFKQQIQKRLCDGVSLASIPCGLTADLLDLDFSNVAHYSIFGMDIDLESLAQSQQIAEERGMGDFCQFVQKDAWDLGLEDQFDVIASNGLSIYESDDKKIVELYRQFFLALKPNGWLVTSFLTPPPLPGTKTEWDLKAINSEHALLQKILFSDILECKWQVFRAEEVVRSQLSEAGFAEIEIIYDKAHIFPTVVAKKA